ncbi:MAG: hypothetical protein E7414_05970 [Ruminococcaceae bacterium]|nr:hypothetical protein [Oscillospiraceae bacterium]
MRKKTALSMLLSLCLLASFLPAGAVEPAFDETAATTEPVESTEATPTLPPAGPLEEIDESLEEADLSSPTEPLLPPAEPELPVPRAEDVSLSFSAFPGFVYPGEKLQVTVSVTYAGESTLCGAVWLFNGAPVPGFSNESFSLTDGKTSTLFWDITEEWRDCDSMELGFMLYGKESELGSLYRSITIIGAENETERRAEERAYVDAVVRPVCVEGSIIQNAPLYSDVMLTHRIGTVTSGTACQILNSKSGFSNQVLLADGRRGWVSLGSLSVSTKNYTKEVDILNREKDLFVNSKGYQSSTDYLVWVHLETQKVNVFLKKEGRWCIERVFPCASGKNVTPTINGVFSYSELVKRWPYANYYVGPVMIFYGNYALHSTLLRYDGSVYDGTIGRPASNGCVRMNPEDIQWMTDYVPLKTTVVVY